MPFNDDHTGPFPIAAFNITTRLSQNVRIGRPLSHLQHLGEAAAERLSDEDFEALLERDRAAERSRKRGLYGGKPRRRPRDTDCMVERVEFELPVPISEQPDDNMLSGP